MKVLSFLFLTILAITNSNIFPINKQKHKNFPSKKPIIAIYGNPYPETRPELTTGNYYPISYVYWLQSFGAEVIAIHQYYSEEKISQILTKINGVLFLGGSTQIVKSKNWFAKAKQIISYSLKNSLPIWGTCQGFQLLGIVLSEDDNFLVNGYDDANTLHPIILTDKGKSSRMYKLFTNTDLLEKYNSTIYNHEWGITEKSFNDNKNINSKVFISSNSHDKNKKYFIDSFESINEKDKIYAVQYHPEKNPYKRYKYVVPQTMDSLKVSHLLGMFFVDECRKNEQAMDEEFRKEVDFLSVYSKDLMGRFSIPDETYYFIKG